MSEAHEIPRPSQLWKPLDPERKLKAAGAVLPCIAAVELPLLVHYVGAPLPAAVGIQRWLWRDLERHV